MLTTSPVAVLAATTPTVQPRYMMEPWGRSRAAAMSPQVLFASVTSGRTTVAEARSKTLFPKKARVPSLLKAT